MIALHYMKKKVPKSLFVAFFTDLYTWICIGNK